MKTLNLDKFVVAGEEKRQLVIGGVSYPVEDMTVENFIATTRAAEALREEDSVVVQVQATIDMIVRTVPTIDVATLGRLSLNKLQAIVAFVRNGSEGDQAEPVEGEAGK